jgi:hypothetical protein
MVRVLMSVGVMRVGEITVGVMTVGVMRRPRNYIEDCATIPIKVLQKIY